VEKLRVCIKETGWTGNGIRRDAQASEKQNHPCAVTEKVEKDIRIQLHVKM